MKALKRVAAAVTRVYFRIGVHILVTVAGVIGAVAPPPTLEMATDTFLRFLWSAFLIIGGLSCMWGLWRLTYRPQIVGSFAVATGTGIYAAALLGNPRGLFAALIMLAFTQSQITRGVQLRQLDDGADGRSGGSPADAILGAVVGRGDPSGVSDSDRDRDGTLAEGVDYGSEAATSGELRSGTHSSQRRTARRPDARPYGEEPGAPAPRGPSA